MPTKVRAPIYNMPRVPVTDEVLLTGTDDVMFAELAASSEADLTLLAAGFILIGVLYSVKYLLLPLVKLLSPSGGNLLQRITNWLESELLGPVKSILRWVVNRVTVGIEAHTRHFARTVESWAIMIHDTCWAAAHFAEATVSAISILRTKILPRVINAKLVPVKKRIRVLETIRAQLDAIARKYNYKDFPTLVRTATPHIKQLVAADIYVESQKHTSLAGALSVYEAAAKSWNKTTTEVKKLGYYDIPSYIRHTDNIIEHQLKPQLKKQQLEIGRIQNLLSLTAIGIPVLLAKMAPKAIAAFFRPAIPEVCTEVGDCAASNLLGKSNWNWLKSMLGLLLAASIDAMLLSDLCGIARAAQAIAGEFSGPLRDLAIGEGTLFNKGCGGNGHTIGPPKY